MLETLARKMTELGFTQYEAKAYISLLQHSPVTRYELSKNSGIPRSAIYDVIRRLESYGAVSALSTQPERYIPLPPDEFLNMLSQRYQKRLEDFRNSLQEIKTAIQPGHLWNITGYTHLIAKAREMIQEAQEEIYISAWRREIREIEQDLRDAEKRGVKIVIFSFTRIPQIGLVYSYGLEERQLEKIWDHKLILIRDRMELIMGEANKQYERQAAWTKNKAIVQIATNHIILDITLYGLRAGVDVSDAVIEMHPGEFETLGKLLREKFPDNPIVNLDFSRQPRTNELLKLDQSNERDE